MKKAIGIILMLLLVIGTACQSGEVKQENEEEETTIDQKAEDKPIDKTITVKDELNFDQFDVEVKEVKVNEKNDVLLADIKLDWRNKAQDYSSDKMSLYVATLFDVKQGEEKLIETNDAWNPENKNSSEVFFQNALGGKTGVRMTYELIDSETPIDLVFTPTIDEDNPETITIDIN